MKQLNWKYLLLIILAIPVVNQIAGYLGRTTAEKVNEKESSIASQQTGNQEIRVVVSSQDAEGVTQQNFDINFLKNLEAYTIKRVKQKANEYFASQGQQNTQLDITSEATYVETGPTKLAVVRLKSSESNHVLIVGIVGKELKRVSCIKNSIETIPISYGVCGDKIGEIFTAKIGR